jgi:hypothetical protein
MDYDSSQLNLYASKRPKFFLVLAILLYLVAGMLSIAQDKNFDNPLGARFVLLQGKIKAFYYYASGLTNTVREIDDQDKIEQLKALGYLQ